MNDLNGMSADQLRAALAEYYRQPQQASSTKQPVSADDARTNFILSLPASKITPQDREHLAKAAMEAAERWKRGESE